MNVKLLLNQHVRDHLNFQRGLLVMVFFLFSAFAAQAQTVTSDKDDYSPGQTAIITGSGWLNDDYLDVRFEEEPAYHGEHLHDKHDLVVNPDGTWRVEYPIEERHLGVAFTVHVIGKQSGAEAYTYFTDAGIRNVSIVGTTSNSFCAGQVLKVKFEATSANLSPAGGGSFSDENVFYVQLSNASGVFPASQAPADNVNIGYEAASTNGYYDVSTTIPNGTTTGTYKIRVVSTAPVTNAPEIGVYSITAKPTIANAGTDQIGVNGTSTTLAANATTVGTGEWSIVSGTGGSFGNTSPTTSTSSNRNATFNGTAGSTYVLRWTITNGACTSTDDVTISFSSIVSTTTTLASSVNPSVYAQSVTFTATVAPKSGTSTPTGNVVFKNGSDVIGTVALSSVSGAQRSIFTTSALAVNTSGHSITAVYQGAGNFETSSSNVISQSVNKAPATVTLAGLTGQVYNGTAKRATATTDPDGLTVEFTYNGSATEPTGAGSYTVVGTINSANYVGSATGTLLIGKAATTTVVTLAEGPFTYTGSAITPATVSVTGAGGLDITPDAAYSNNTNAGTATASFNYAETANYLASADSKTFTIDKATPTFTNLVSSSINCGFETVTLSGKIARGNLIPTGIINIILNGVEQSTAIQADGSFNTTFNTSGLGSASTAYSVTYEYAGDSNFNGITDNSTGLTVNSVLVDANAYSTPQAVKSTATTVTVSVTNSSRVAVSGVPVIIFFNDREFSVINTNASGIASFNVGILPTGVYKIRAVAGAGCDVTTVYLPVYDPEGGFVTGGGWIDSPAGAYKSDLSLTGKANFGFNAKYKKGSTVPDGQTQFQFHAGNMNFHSSVYEDMRLVIAGAKANYKGVGTINGTGNYGFMVSAIDGQVNGGGGVDKFRIKIWDKANGDVVVYDNNIDNTDENAEPATALGGGSIVIHEVKSAGNASTSKKLVAATPILEKPITKFQNYPNPYTDRTTITFSSSKEESFALEVYDVKGALVKKVDMGVTEAVKTYEYELDSRNMPEGMYFARLITSSGVQTIKMVLKR